jgi:hypothetical protein
MYMYNSSGIYIFYCLLFIYIYIKIMYLMNKYKEGFTPKIREMYRPYMRHSRIFYEDTKNNYLYRINRFFRNIGLDLL